MLATLPDTDRSEARNYGGDKETVDTFDVIVFDDSASPESMDACDGRFRNPVTLRIYMGRSRTASVVYASVWIHTRDGRYLSGTGKAGGYGYCKRSSAAREALRSAGIAFDEHWSASGIGKVREALIATAHACGYADVPLTVNES